MTWAVAQRCTMVWWARSARTFHAGHVGTLAVSPEAVELRNRGLAELENEKPELAEQAYRQLTEVAPKDPLGFANLAIAELRQQKNDAAMA